MNDEVPFDPNGPYPDNSPDTLERVARFLRDVEHNMAWEEHLRAMRTHDAVQPGKRRKRTNDGDKT